MKQTYRSAIFLIVTSILALSLPLAALSASTLPRSEHPFPQMMRSEWLNLNGEWEFAETDESSDAKYLGSEAYPDKIIVPFCRESKLSGLERKGFIKNVWYRRTFVVPVLWKSQRIRLHVGACDWKTRVWVNGKLVGEHIGGSAPFTFEVTKHVKRGDTNTVVIHAYDDTRSGLQPLGKQSTAEGSYGCVYTRTTGIWQTVWLEGVGSSFINDCRIEPDPQNSRVLLQPEIQESNGLKIKAVAYAGNKVVGTIESPANWRDNNLVMNLSTKRLWAVEDPFLYSLKLVLLRDGKVIDQVNSYFGLRDVTIQGAAILINGKPVFQRLVLDQGFYPDGIWTAPSDEALKHDIEMSQAVGFNGARLHQKVFEPRFLYWADKLGYLVWGEFPNWGMDHGNPNVFLPVINEWGEILRRDRNHPAIVGWCPFNESPGNAVPLQNTVVNLTKLVDPTRPVIDSSGWSHGYPEPDVLDAHDYDQNPASFRARWMLSDVPERYTGGSGIFVPYMVSEYGGIGWNLNSGWGYGNAPGSEKEFYERLKGLTDALMDNRFHFGFCYTQLTDVEQEQNGIYTYDRKSKFDVKKINAIFSRPAACESDPAFVNARKLPKWNVLVGAFPDGDLCKEWRYTFDSPYTGWEKPGFDDSSWSKGLSGFGSKSGWEHATRTTWNTSDIYLRQEFDCSDATINKALLVLHYDNATEVYLNGEQIWTGTGWTDNYACFDVTNTVRKALKPGKNQISIHCHQDTGGQYIDAALLVDVKKKE